MHEIVREMEEVFLQRCQLTCKLLRMETFSASRCHVPLCGHQLTSVWHADGYGNSSVISGWQLRELGLEEKKKKSSPWELSDFSTSPALSTIWKIPNSLFNSLLIETCRVFSISCTELWHNCSASFVDVVKIPHAYPDYTNEGFTL